jgi:hypothetical protein
MKPLDRLSEYLGAIEKRLRLLALTRGIAVTAGLALALTVLAVLVINQFAFSNPSVIGARVFLFLGLAAAIAAVLVIPVIRLNRRHAARKAEASHPAFEERLLTFTERQEQRPEDPFLELLAMDTLDVAQKAEPKTVAKDSWIVGFSSAAVLSIAVLVWLGTTSGFMGYGTSLLWAGLPKGTSAKPFYAIQVTPGNRTVRKRSDQVISAQLVGFSAPKVRFFARYASASQWEQAEMGAEPGGNAYQFLIAGVPETLEYYVEAGGVKSDTYKLNVVDLPGVKKIRVTYHFPAWLGLKDETEDPGGDLRAVEGTNAEVAVQTDRPLSSGVLILDDGSKLTLKSGANGLLTATVPIKKDGVYHVAAMESGEDVRLSEDYFIEAQKDRPPEIKITRPGRDYKASPIEEVAINVEAKDDFGLKSVELRYSVNGGPEKTVAMPAGAKTASGNTLISLEDFKVEPGDVVALYAVAKDARSTTNTDIYFIEAQPFERNYSQSQQAGGGGGGGDDDSDQQNQISQRQKEIIAATWNQIKGGGAKGTDAENAAFLSNQQAKLRDQAKSLGDRMKARQLTEAGDSFKSFVKDMEQAVEAMGPAVDKLKAVKWQDALAPEQKALQYLMRAEATFRDIQVAFGNQRQGGGGGGGAGGARDLEGLFDLELDTEKNQYESNRSQQSSGGQQQKIDEAMQKLEQLARRQQELADQAKKNPQAAAQQRWQQEMLRREAEQLRQQMEQLQREGQGQQLSRNGQQGQQSQSGGSPQSGQSGQQSGQQQQGGRMGQQQQTGPMNGQPQNGQMQNGQQQNGQQQDGSQRTMQQQQQMSGVRGADPRQLQQMLDRLNQSIDAMRGAASSQQAGTPSGEAQARRAAESLNEARQMLQGMRNNQTAGQLDNLVQQAEDLARRQQAFEGQMRRTFGQANQGGVTQQQANQMAGEKEGEIQDLKKLEQGMQSAVRDLQNTQRKAATKMRETLSEMQQAELARDMQRNADWIRRGIGQYGVMSEATVTQGLNELRDQLKQVQQMIGQAGGKDDKAAQGDKMAEQTLGQVERLRLQLEQMAGRSQQGNQPGQRGNQQGQRANQAGNQQGGNQQGGNQQGGNQQGGNQQGGNQQGGNQQGGNQQGGNQQGGNQQGGNQQGGNQPGGNNQMGGGNPQSGGGNNTYGPGGPRNGGYYNGNPQGGPWFGGYWGTAGPVRPEDFTNQYNQTLQALRQLEQAGQGDPNLIHDLQNLIRDMQRLNPNTYANDPLLAERIQATLMGGVQQVEMELRRKVEEANGTGSVRSPGGDKVPQGWEGSVAEYFRKLSKSKQ